MPEQSQLPLDPVAMLPMREAYLRTGYPEAHISFEEACRSPGLYIPMKNIAEAIARTK